MTTDGFEVPEAASTTSHLLASAVSFMAPVGMYPIHRQTPFLIVRFVTMPVRDAGSMGYGGVPALSGWFRILGTLAALHACAGTDEPPWLTDPKTNGL